MLILLPTTQLLLRLVMAMAELLMYAVVSDAAADAADEYYGSAHLNLCWPNRSNTKQI